MNGNFTITLQNKSMENSKVSIFSLDGKKVFEQVNLKAGANFIASSLKTGVYILHFEGDIGVSMIKIIVK